MSSTKCENCGLVNFKSQEKCKRCQLPLSEAGMHAAGFPSLQQEREAAQTSGGVWQDSKKVVLHLNAPLPERCIKCNSSQGVTQKIYTLKHYSITSVFTLLLIGFGRYKKVGVEAGLCSVHRGKRRQRVLWGVGAIAASIAILLVGVVVESLFALVIVGFLLFCGSCLYLACLGDPLSVAKIKEPYIWLKGADESYLSALPKWRGGQHEPLY